jgi:hypothetical protein
MTLDVLETTKRGEFCSGDQPPHYVIQSNFLAIISTSYVTLVQVIIPVCVDYNIGPSMMEPQVDPEPPKVLTVQKVAPVLIGIILGLQ